ncbi:hypothetical protein LNKW23_41810 [Paralimibaculum aggregatum]|uniref:Uncharacterized protein n=1 Tax=Paralimibaculum aggregatum TaxID=3036245 RepID=A0ABQ6LQN3_9RHOB|nr:hypothetical protein LNKW23_41810 [Limibaculum sp. NKW23]
MVDAEKFYDKSEEEVQAYCLLQSVKGIAALGAVSFVFGAAALATVNLVGGDHMPEIDGSVRSPAATTAAAPKMRTESPPDRFWHLRPL